MLNKVIKAFSFFIASAIIYFIVISLLSIGNSESNIMIRLYIAVIAGVFNSLFILILSITKIFDVLQLSLTKQFIEMLLYIVLMLAFDYLARNASLSHTARSFFDYPFSFIYPCILIFILILSVRKKYVNMN